MDKGTFNHSVKVPKLYKCAAKISREVAGGASSIKQLVYEKKHFNTKALYALVVTTFQKGNELDLLLKRTKLLEKETRLDPWLAKILISELLWGKMQLPKSDSKPILTILAYEQVFRAHLSDSSRDNCSGQQQTHKKPRYIRVNTLITTVNEALEQFQDEGWTLLSSNNWKTYGDFLEQVANLAGDFFLRDFHIPDVLIFPSGTEFYNHQGYKNGTIVLQDKASCLPAFILSPPMGSLVLDMCAAPGMKTTQLAAILQDNGTIFAVERDPKRFEVLKKMVQTSGTTCVKAINRDVLECSDFDFPNVEYILIDPSCSGSGMTNRLEVTPAHDESRLQKLAGFQIKILRNALTRYHNTKRVVYSTCSLYPEENEDVVRQVLETNNQFKLVPATNYLNGEWDNFGSSDFGNIGKYCLYAKPEKDLTNGFFLAVFERLTEGESNEFYNRKLFSYRSDVDHKQARKNRKNEINDTDNMMLENKDHINEIDSLKYGKVQLKDSIKKKKRKKEKGETNVESEKDNNLKEISIIDKGFNDKSNIYEVITNDVGIGSQENDSSSSVVKKKKRKKLKGETSGQNTKTLDISDEGNVNRVVNNMEIDSQGNATLSEGKKRKKRKKGNENTNNLTVPELGVSDHFINNITVMDLSKSKMKKAKHTKQFDVFEESKTENDVEAEPVKCKKKKRMKSPVASCDVNLDHFITTTPNVSAERKRKKHKHNKVDIVLQ